MNNPVLRPAEILLPAEGQDLGKWSVLACDQFTSQPEYWQDVDGIVGDAPSTLRIILPEVYLEAPDVKQRVEKIHSNMRQYLGSVLTRSVTGYIYVERELDNGAVRQGLVGVVDLEDYSYKKGEKCRIRPSENTVVERIPPRLAVRRGAPLETPHILMLADDVQNTIIEPLAAKKEKLEKLYDQPLMLEGGVLRGWAVTNADDVQEVSEALQKLDDADAYHKRYGAPESDPGFALAVGDGNHSLATAKAWWEEVKQTLPPAQQQNHPARYCLVELENVQSPAIEIEPIHRVVFGATPQDFIEQFTAFVAVNGGQKVKADVPAQQFIVVGGGTKEQFGFKDTTWPLAVGTLEAFLAFYLEQNPGFKVDFVHGEEAVQQLTAKGDATGILLPEFEKSDLFRGVALGGVLPRKTFSMGTAIQKRYYLECRKIEE